MTLVTQIRHAEGRRPAFNLRRTLGRRPAVARFRVLDHFVEITCLRISAPFNLDFDEVHYATGDHRTLAQEFGHSALLLTHAAMSAPYHRRLEPRVVRAGWRGSVCTRSPASRP